MINQSNSTPPLPLLPLSPLCHLSSALIIPHHPSVPLYRPSVAPLSPLIFSCIPCPPVITHTNSPPHCSSPFSPCPTLCRGTWTLCTMWRAWTRLTRWREYSATSRNFISCMTDSFWFSSQRRPTESDLHILSKNMWVLLWCNHTHCIVWWLIHMQKCVTAPNIVTPPYCTVLHYCMCLLYFTFSAVLLIMHCTANIVLLIMQSTTRNDYYLCTKN